MPSIFISFLSSSRRISSKSSLTNGSPPVILKDATFDSRACLINSALSANVLLLDEPTNHLDLETLEALEETVAHYEGTIVLVSHDRYFLEKFCTTDTYVLSDGKLTRQQSFEAYMTNIEQKVKCLHREWVK